MSSFIPTDRDRLGLRRAWGASTYAMDMVGVSPAVPNNETCVVMNWARHDLGGLVATDHFTGAMCWRVATGESVVQIRVRDTIAFAAYDVAWQRITTNIPDGGDHLYTTICDRDNTKLEGYIDGSRVDSVALTQNPDLTAGMTYQINNSTGQLYSDTLWRCAILSLAPGATLTQAQWAEVLDYMADPDAPMHPLLTAALGSVYCNYYPGRGVYGSTTVYDTGTAANDLWLSAALQTVRTRARTPWRRPRRTWYGLKRGYTATTAATDFGFAVQPVILRALYDNPANASAGYGAYLGNGGVTKGFYFRQIASNGTTRITIQNSGPSYDFEMNNELRYQGGDIYFICNGTDVKMLLNGQQIDGRTMANPLDITGAIQCTMNGPYCRVARIAAWNPAVVPATLEDEIRACVCNPELDPPSLTNKRCDFGLNSATLPLATSTVVANAGLGGGSLTLSAQRSTSCGDMLVGTSP